MLDVIWLADEQRGYRVYSFLTWYYLNIQDNLGIR